MNNTERENTVGLIMCVGMFGWCICKHTQGFAYFSVSLFTVVYTLYVHAAHVQDAANWLAVLSCLYVTIKLSPLQTVIMDHSQCHEDNFYFITQ